MPIRIQCKNGHRLSIRNGNAGQVLKCPVCQTSVAVPIRAMNNADDAILALLGPPASTPPAKDTSAANEDSPVVLKLELPETKRCPKCRANVRSGYHLCPHCQTYFSDDREIRRRMTGA